MAANFWDSTQRKNWLFTKEQLVTKRQALLDDEPTLVQMYSLPEWRHMNIYFNQQINKLGRKLGVRQQVMATAQMYIKRFYINVEVRRTNPLLVAITAVYLACKMEENPQHIRLIMNETHKIWPTETSTFDVPKIGECEFYLISEMHANLIVHQPYRTLNALQTKFYLSNDDVALASSFINDHYMTDLPLVYAPHTVALASIMLALVLRPPTGAQSGSGPGGAGQVGSVPLSLNLANATHIMQQTAARAAQQGGGGSSGNYGGLAISPSRQRQQQQQQQYRAQQAKSALAQKEAQLNREKSKLQRFASWLSESGVDVEAMIDCTQELIAFYECHEQYNDKGTRDQISRFVKGRGM
ncbi:hypothetical protein RB597_006055 [Gaeumannomyces tritici]